MKFIIHKDGKYFYSHRGGGDIWGNDPGLAKQFTRAIANAIARFENAEVKPAP